MNTLEAALKDKKKELDEIKAPEELETRLRTALQERKRKVKYKLAVSLLMAALLFTYSFDSLAYYGKKFTGYEQVTMGSLKQLNEEGRGQEIGKSCTFSNGIEVTIDGIMFDENELVAFYKVHTSQGNIQDISDGSLPKLHLSGIKPGGYNITTGHGVIVDDQNMSFMDTLKPPHFYEKWMRFDVEMTVGKKVEVRSIDFTLDRNLAMKRTARIELNAEARIDDYRILFDHLTASAMSSVIDGRIVPLTDKALKVFDPDTAAGSMEIPRLRFDIVSDDGEVSQFYGGQGVSNSKISFNSRSDALTENFKELQIRNIRLETLKLLDKTVDINPDIGDIQIADDLILKRVYQEGSDTCVVISSRGIPAMGLFEGDKQLTQVNPEALELEVESPTPVERTYRFEGTSKDLKLVIKYIRYSKISSDNIDIPIN